MHFGIDFLILVVMSTLKAFILQERTTGQYVADTGRSVYNGHGTALGLVSEVEKATKFVHKQIPNSTSPLGVNISVEGNEGRLFNCAHCNFNTSTPSEIYIKGHSPGSDYELGNPSQQYRIHKDADGYYQIVMLTNPAKFMRYDKDKKQFVTNGPFVPGNGFRMMELKPKEAAAPRRRKHVSSHHDHESSSSSSSSEHH